jgi:hypothetical protein
MWGLFQRLLAAFATFGSFVALVVSLRAPGQPFTPWQVVLCTVSIVAFGIGVGFEVHDYFRSKPKVMRTDKKIRNYMYKWIKRGGRVAIFSRSLSWVSDAEMLEMLKAKAATRDLTVVMPTTAGRSSDLEMAGARVIYYGDDSYSIRSRFTIVNRGRTDTGVAIGRTDNRGRHIVTEYYAADNDPAYWLAEDLIELLLKQTARPERSHGSNE